MSFEKLLVGGGARGLNDILPNRNVIVSIVGREIEEKMPFKPLILTPPAKIVDNCLLLRFRRQFFCVHVPD